MTGRYDDNENIYLDDGFLGRLRSNGFTTTDVETLLLMGKGRLNTIISSFNGTLHPTLNVYKFMVEEIPKAPNIKIVFLLPIVHISVAHAILDRLSDDVLLAVTLRLSQLVAFKRIELMPRYTDVVIYALNRIFVRHLSGYYEKNKILDDVGTIVYNLKLNEVQPLLYRNLNEVFNLDRWQNKRKLLNLN